LGVYGRSSLGLGGKADAFEQVSIEPHAHAVGGSIP
jgi:hypothetical protein